MSGIAARLGALLLALVMVRPADAQAPQRLVVLTESGTPVVAADFLLSVGPGDEEERLAGIGYLSARTLIAPLRATFDSLGVHVNVSAHKDALSFSVIAAPDAWKEATTALLTTLFRAPPDSVALERERSAIVLELASRAANPADAATRELDRAFFGDDHPWGRPTVGTQQSLRRITFDEASEFMRLNFTPDRALVAVVGPVDQQEVREHLLPLMSAAFPAPVDLLPFDPAERPVRRDYNSITTWVLASFRFPETGDEEALRFVSFLAGEALSFSPTQRSVYDVWTEVVPRLGGGEIRLRVVIPPEEAEDWAGRVDDAVRELAAAPMIEDVFENHLRRYRGERALALVTPEDRASAAVRQLLVAGAPSPLVPDLSEMTQERVREAARSLSAPTIVVLGPILD